MSEIDKLVEVKSCSLVDIGGVLLNFLTDPSGDAWLTKESIVEVLCRDGNYSFRTSFPNIFEAKVLINFDSGRVKNAIINGVKQRVFHESALYRGMFEANQIHGFNNKKVTEMIDSIFMDVLPSLRKFGQYPPPKNKQEVSVSKWGAIREIATQMEHIALLGEEHDKRIRELEWKTTMIDEEKIRDQNEIKYLRDGQVELQNQMNELLGTPEHRTVRLRMMELGIRRSTIERSKMEVGQQCKKYCEINKIPLPEKIPDGKFMVNQYPVEVIDATLKNLNLFDDTAQSQPSLLS